MNKFIKKLNYIAVLVLAIAVASCSDDIADEIKTLETSRLFSPTNVETRVVNQTGVRISWKEVNKAKTYNIEVYDNGDENFEGNPVKTAAGITFDQVPYTITGFDGDAKYSVRVQAIAEGIGESKWTSATFKTDTEQIFYAVDPEEVKARQVTLRWPAGQTATNILLTPGDINYTVTSNDVAAGAATITDLADNTEYTATLMNNGKVRGTASFKTLIDLGNATAVYPEDDLVAILDAAEEGAEFILFPGEYTLGDYAVTKSLSLAGYLPNNKPIIYGRFTFGTDISALTLSTLSMLGNNGVDVALTNPLEASAACKVGAITITGCDFNDYSRAVIYNNNKAEFGDILISNCTFNNFPGDGGDGIDFRGGALNSFIVEHTTFNTGFRAFLRMQAEANVAFRNCTFFRVANFNNSNNSGLFRMSGGGTFEVSKCLFVETGVKGGEYGNWCKNSGNMKAEATYSNNYYYDCHNLWAGLYTNPAECKAQEADPGFKNPEAGDFTLSNEDLIYNQIGDQRWW